MGRKPAVERSQERRMRIWSTMPTRCAMCSQKPIALPPDTIWNYNGGGTDLLGAIIEKASGNAVRRLCARGAVRAARHHRLGVEGLPQRQVRDRPPDCACARAMPQRSASSCSTRAPGTARRSSPRNGSPTRSSRASRRSAMFGGLFFYGYQWWIGRTLRRTTGTIPWIAGQGLGRPAPVHRSRARSRRRWSPRRMYASPRQGHAGLDILSNFVIPAVRDKQRPLKSTPCESNHRHDLAFHRRRHDHPSHHRAGGPVHACARHDRRTDAGTAGREPPLAAARRRSMPTTRCCSASSPTSSRRRITRSWSTAASATTSRARAVRPGT